ncbi:MAG: type II CAAX prenyl endopeptidase Rce1 family protein [Candidatus Geothermarchaeales archaeon]
MADIADVEKELKGKTLRVYWYLLRERRESAGILAAILFMLAHIGFTFSPFAITHFSLSQQFLAFVHGLYYAIVFHRTGSLLGPIISHGYSNGMLFVVLYSMAFLFS